MAIKFENTHWARTASPNVVSHSSFSIIKGQIPRLLQFSNTISKPERTWNHDRANTYGGSVSTCRCRFLYQSPPITTNHHPITTQMEFQSPSNHLVTQTSSAHRSGFDNVQNVSFKWIPTAENSCLLFPSRAVVPYHVSPFPFFVFAGGIGWRS